MTLSKQLAHLNNKENNIISNPQSFAGILEQCLEQNGL